MLLVFQLDFDIQLQRCLNESLYEMAKDVRAARTKVDEALEELMKWKLSQQSKQDGDQVAPAGKVLAPSEYASEGLRLRMQQQKAVESENYKEAARIRDLIAALDLERKKAESALSASSTSFSVNPILRLGQRVKHKQDGYRAVVVGWDLKCCESDEWQSLHPPSAQGPYYHLLVDVRDWQWMENGEAVGLPPMAYVPQSLLSAPEIDPTPHEAPLLDESVQPQEQGVRTWKSVYGDDKLQHPFDENLFLGRDSGGDYIPCRKLRDKYNIPRRNA